MPRPIPTHVFHFTRVEHLETIATSGLVCDRKVQGLGVLSHEVGDTGIKGRRMIRAVPVEPGGVVADYVPFYFAPRSPMMYSIAKGNVPTYQDGTDRLVYLVTTLEHLQNAGVELILTDRNAVLTLTEFVPFDGNDPPEGHVDWDLMKATLWFDTAEYPDRKERRMAECLAFGAVPWECITHVVTQSESVAGEVRALLGPDVSSPRVEVRPRWCF